MQIIPTSIATQNAAPQTSSQTAVEDGGFAGLLNAQEGQLATGETSSAAPSAGAEGEPAIEAQEPLEGEEVETSTQEPDEADEVDGAEVETPLEEVPDTALSATPRSPSPETVARQPWRGIHGALEEAEAEPAENAGPKPEASESAGSGQGQLAAEMPPSDLLEAPSNPLDAPTALQEQTPADQTDGAPAIEVGVIAASNQEPLADLQAAPDPALQVPPALPGELGEAVAPKVKEIFAAGVTPQVQVVRAPQGELRQVAPGTDGAATRGQAEMAWPSGIDIEVQTEPEGQFDLAPEAQEDQPALTKVAPAVGAKNAGREAADVAPVKTQPLEGVGRADLDPTSLRAALADQARPTPESSAPQRPSSPIVQKVAEQIAKVASESGTTIIRLKPYGMGTIEISVDRSKAGRLDVEMRVQNPMVLDAMRNERGAISHLFNAGSGQAGGTLSMDLLHSGNGRSDPEQRREAPSGAAAQTEEEDEAPETPSTPVKSAPDTGALNILT